MWLVLHADASLVSLIVGCTGVSTWSTFMDITWHNGSYSCGSLDYCKMGVSRGRQNLDTCLRHLRLKQPVVSTDTDGSSWLHLCFLVLFLCLLTPAILGKLLPGELDLKEPESWLSTTSWFLVSYQPYKVHSRFPPDPVASLVMLKFSEGSHWALRFCFVWLKYPHLQQMAQWLVENLSPDHSVSLVP